MGARAHAPGGAPRSGTRETHTSHAERSTICSWWTTKRGRARFDSRRLPAGPSCVPKGRRAFRLCWNCRGSWRQRNELRCRGGNGPGHSSTVGPRFLSGGARPKASVREKNGQLGIAKFPHKSDETNTVLWEALALRLAAKAGITVPSWKLEKVSRKPVLLLQRFDRSGGEREFRFCRR